MSNPSVLVVDDEPGVRRTICRYLRQRGCIPEEAADGAAALALLRARDFDAVVSDISMPNVDGVELWVQAAAERPAMKDRFVFASALPRPAGLDGEAIRFVRKPFELGQLWTALEPIFEGSTA